MKNVSGFINCKIMPAMGKISQIKVIKAIQYGAMATMPLTLGVSLIAILVNLPITSWLDFLSATGIDVHMRAVIKVTMEIMALYMTFMIGYYNANERDSSPIPAGIISLAAFLALTPQTVSYEGGVASGLDFSSLGGNGIFGGMVVAILVSSLYSYLSKKGMVIKLPDSVPPMVSQSLSPTFIAITIFIIVLLIRILIGITPWGDYLTFINTFVGTPIISLGASPTSAIIFHILVSFFWFFGIHPSTLLSIYMPVLLTTSNGNLTAFMNGDPIPYLGFSAVMAFFSMGGAGNTIGLSLIMPFISKSERYKVLGKLTFAPGFFNINEPLVFGLPIMLNPIFFIPLIITSLFNGLLGLISYNLGIYDTFNPSITMPWITPAFITAIFTVGIKGMVVALIAMILDGLIYLPFFLKADKEAVKIEKEGDKANAEV